MQRLLRYGLPLGFLCLMVVLPVTRLMFEGIPNWHWEVWAEPFVQWRVIWSLSQAALTSLVGLLLGIPMAWILARYDFFGRSIILRLLILPFVVPTLIAALGVLALFGPTGLFCSTLSETPYLLFYGNLFYNLPLVVRAGVEGFSRVPACHVAAARSLGATRWQTFWRIECPEAAPWLKSAACLVFLYCFTGFGLALLLGGQQYATLEVEIYTLVAHQLALAEATALALLTVSISGAIVWLYARLEQGQQRPLLGPPIARRHATGTTERAMLLGTLLTLAFFIAAPLLAIVWRALCSERHLWQLWLHEDTLGALATTLRFTLYTIAGAMLLGILHGMSAQRSAPMRALVFLPTLASPICIAFGLLLAYPPLIASVWLLLGAYVLFAYPLVSLNLADHLSAQPASLVCAARSLGASPWYAFWHITYPLLTPSLRRGIAFAAATALGEFAITLFLSRPEWTTLTTLIYRHFGRPGANHLEATWIIASGLLFFSLLLFLLIEWPIWDRNARTR